MSDYFEEVINNLTLEDLSILGVLRDKEADASFKAIKSRLIVEETELTKHKYHNSLQKLLTTCFIDTVKGSKNSMLFITPYGLTALEYSLEGVEQYD